MPIIRYLASIALLSLLCTCGPAPSVEGSEGLKEGRSEALKEGTRPNVIFIMGRSAPLGRDRET